VSAVCCDPATTRPPPPPGRPQIALASCSTAASAGVLRWQLSQGICTCTACQGLLQARFSSLPLRSTVRCPCGNSTATSTTRPRLPHCGD